jgi:hypothetical protein
LKRTTSTQETTTGYFDLLRHTLTAIQLAISGVFFPTRNAILPDIVSRQELGAANALNSATWSVMLALGAALGGLVSGTWGMYPVMILFGSVPDENGSEQQPGWRRRQSLRPGTCDGPSPQARCISPVR